MLRRFLGNPPKTIQDFCRRSAKFDLTLYANEGGNIFGTGKYTLNYVAEISAIPNSGYHLEKWSDEKIANIRNYTILDDSTLSAFFKRKLYTELEFIESTGTQWIDTAVKAYHTTKIQLKYMPKTFTGYCAIGYYNDNDFNDFRFFDNNGMYYFDLKSSRINGGSISLNQIYELEIGNYYVKHYGSKTNIIEGQYVSSYTSLGTLKLYKADSEQSASGSGRIYYIKIYSSNDVLVRDLIPVKDQNDVVCMYDKVSETFFYNQGTGVFIAGSEKEQDIYIEDLNGNTIKVNNDEVITDNGYFDTITQTF